MPAHTWKLIDVDRDIYHETWEAHPSHLGAESRNISVRKRVLRGGLRDGLNVVEVAERGGLHFTVLADRGMGLWRLQYGDLQFGWTSPVRGPVHPRFVPQDEATGIGWLSGFDELLVRCGLEYNGAPEWDATGKLVHTLHGRIANLPAQTLEVTLDTDAQTVTVTGEVDEARLFCNSVRLRSSVTWEWGTPRLSIVDEITALSSGGADLELLYHLNVGSPFLSPGASVHFAHRAVAPRDVPSCADLPNWQTYPAQQVGVPETVLYFEPLADQDGWATALLANTNRQAGLSVRFRPAQLPWFVLWKNNRPPEDGYVTGLEPALNLPNVKSYEQQQGRVRRLAQGETFRSDLLLEVHPSAYAVAAVEQAIENLQRTVEPHVSHRPRTGWSPAGDA